MGKTKQMNEARVKKREDRAEKHDVTEDNMEEIFNTLVVDENTPMKGHRDAVQKGTHKVAWKWSQGLIQGLKDEMDDAQHDWNALPFERNKEVKQLAHYWKDLCEALDDELDKAKKLLKARKRQGIEIIEKGFKEEEEKGLVRKLIPGL